MERITHDMPGVSNMSSRDLDAQCSDSNARAHGDPEDEGRGEEDDDVEGEEEEEHLSLQSLLEPPETFVSDSSTATPIPSGAHPPAVTTESPKIQLTNAISQVSSDAGEFYAKVQRWKVIPRAFEHLVSGEESSNSNVVAVVVPKKTVQGWVIAELSRTVFKDDPLDMELVDYVVGLLEHPEFCQPDLLVLELHEFLGNDVTVRGHTRFAFEGVSPVLGANGLGSLLITRSSPCSGLCWRCGSSLSSRSRCGSCL